MKGIEMIFSCTGCGHEIVSGPKTRKAEAFKANKRAFDRCLSCGTECEYVRISPGAASEASRSWESLYTEDGLSDLAIAMLDDIFDDGPGFDPIPLGA